MKHKVFCVYDSKVEAYMTPFVFRSTGEALRSFETTVNDPQSNLCRHPADFTLFEIGEFQEEDGTIAPYSAKKSLGLALDFKKQPQEQLPMFNKGAS